MIYSQHQTRKKLVSLFPAGGNEPLPASEVPKIGRKYHGLCAVVDDRELQQAMYHSVHTFNYKYQDWRISAIGKVTSINLSIFLRYQCYHWIAKFFKRVSLKKW